MRILKNGFHTKNMVGTVMNLRPSSPNASTVIRSSLAGIVLQQVLWLFATGHRFPWFVNGLSKVHRCPALSLLR